MDLYCSTPSVRNVSVYFVRCFWSCSQTALECITDCRTRYSNATGTNEQQILTNSCQSDLNRARRRRFRADGTRQYRALHVIVFEIAICRKRLHLARNRERLLSPAPSGKVNGGALHRDRLLLPAVHLHADRGRHGGNGHTRWLGDHRTHVRTREVASACRNCSSGMTSQIVCAPPGVASVTYGTNGRLPRAAPRARQSGLRLACTEGTGRGLETDASGDDCVALDIPVRFATDASAVGARRRRHSVIRC